MSKLNLIDKSCHYGGNIYRQKNSEQSKCQMYI